MINQITVTKNDSYTMGFNKTDKGYAFAYASSNPKVNLLLFSADTKQPDYTIELNSTHKDGDVFSFIVKGIPAEISFYLYEDGGFVVTDPYATCLKYSEFEARKDAPYGVLNRTRFNKT